MRGKFISVEGTEGAGKSTALQFLKDYLQQKHLDIVLTREPGGTKIAEAIRDVLLHQTPAETMLPKTELLLMFASRAQHIHQQIEPALQAGKWVITDRYIDASYAYQGGGRGLEWHDINLLDRLVVADRYPDLTLLLDVPAEIGFARTETRGTQKDRIEQEKIDFFVRVRNAYLARAKYDPNRIKVINASHALTTVHAQIKQVVDDFLSEIVS